MKNTLCLALGAVLGATATALVGANVIVKSIDKRKSIGNKLASDETINTKLDEIKDPEELKSYVLKLKKALMTDDTDEMEKILSDLLHFKPSKKAENDAEEDEEDFDSDIQYILDEMDSKLSEIFVGFNQQYEDISDKIDTIYSMFTGDDDDESDEDDESDDEWKEIEVQEEEVQEESDTETSPEPESEPEVTHESVIRTMNETIINPLCEKYGEDLRQTLDESICRLVDCGDPTVVDTYIKKFTSAVRSSKGSKKQVQKYITEIEKLSVPSEASAK